MASLTPGAYLSAQRTLGEIDSSRREKMNALNEFMRQSAEAGYELSPAEVQGQIDQLVGSEWYLKGSFPSGQLMDGMMARQKQAAIDTQGKQQIARLQRSNDAQNLLADQLAGLDMNAGDPNEVESAAKKMLGPAYQSYFDTGMIDKTRLAITVQGKRDKIARDALAVDSYATSINDPSLLDANGEGRKTLQAKWGTAVGNLVADRRMADLNSAITTNTGMLIDTLSKDELLQKSYLNPAVGKDAMDHTLRQRVITEWTKKTGTRPTDATIDNMVSRMKDNFEANKTIVQANMPLSIIDTANKMPTLKQAIDSGQFIPELVQKDVDAVAQSLGTSSANVMEVLRGHAEVSGRITNQAYVTKLREKLLDPKAMEEQQKNLVQRQTDALIIEGRSQGMGEKELQKSASIMQILATRYSGVDFARGQIISEIKKGNFEDANIGAATIAKNLGLPALDVAGSQRRVVRELMQGADPFMPFSKHVETQAKDYDVALQALSKRLANVDPTNRNPEYWKQVEADKRDLATFVQIVGSDMQTLLNDARPENVTSRSKYAAGFGSNNEAAQVVNSTVGTTLMKAQELLKQIPDTPQNLQPKVQPKPATPQKQAGPFVPREGGFWR